MKYPFGCKYWEEPELAFDGNINDRFEVIETYEDESRWSRYLLKCRECGQLYFFEFYEVDWMQNEDEPNYSTFIPVDTAVDIETLSKTKNPLELLSHAPRLQHDNPHGGKEPKTHWVKSGPRAA